jgi:hypothetical protein
MYEHLDKLIELATAEGHLERVRDAKEQFFQATGNVYEEDDFYEARMRGFIEFYLFDYRGSQSVPNTIDLVLEEHGAELSAKEVDTFKKFRRGEHSIFELKKVKGDLLVVRNLWNRETFDVTERRQMHGVQKKDLFEARILPYEDHYFFSYAFVFHPKEVRKFILKQLAAVEREYELLDAIQRLAYLRLKFDRYRGMDARRIYSEEAAQQLEK